MMLNLSNEALRVLQKKLGFVSMQNKIDEPKLRKNFKEISQFICSKWYFRNEPTPEFKDLRVFSPKSLWNPSKGQSWCILKSNPT